MCRESRLYLGRPYLGESDVVVARPLMADVAVRFVRAKSPSKSTPLCWKAWQLGFLDGRSEGCVPRSPLLWRRLALDCYA